MKNSVRMRHLVPLIMLPFSVCLAQQASADDTVQLAVQIQALTVELADLSRRVRHAEDYIAINNLQRAYGYYSDKALWNEAADLFTSGCLCPAFSFQESGNGKITWTVPVQVWLSLALP